MLLISWHHNIPKLHAEVMQLPCLTIVKCLIHLILLLSGTIKVEPGSIIAFLEDEIVVLTARIESDIDK